MAPIYKLFHNEAPKEFWREPFILLVNEGGQLWVICVQCNKVLSNKMVNMSFAHWLAQRERAPNIIEKPGNCLDKLLDTLDCYAEDEYHIEGEMGMAVPPFTAKFSKGLLNGHLLGIADEDGNVQLIDSRKSKDSSVIKGWSAHSNAVFDIAWVGKESKILTASGDQTARLWDVEKAETLGIFRGHTCSLKSINVKCDSPFVFATGARDGKIMIWDTRCYMKNGYYGPMNVIHGAHVRVDKNAVHINNRKRKPRRPSMLSSDSKQSVTAVVFQDDNILISSGACDGSIKMWDIRKNYSFCKDSPISYHVIPYPDQSASRKHGYSSLILDSTSSKLFATCINDVIYMYQSLSLPTQPVASFHGHQSSTFYIKSALSPDDRFLLSGSGDDNCYVFKVDAPNQSPWVLKGHVGEVTSVAWCPTDITKVVTCSDDNSFRIWRSSQVLNTNGKSSNRIGSSSRDESTQHTMMPKLTPKLPTNRRVVFTSQDYKSNHPDRIHTQCRADSPTSSSCSTEDGTLSRISVQKTPQQSSALTIITSCSKSAHSTPNSTTPKNSRLILEKWLQTTPSPSAIQSQSPDERKPTRNVLTEQNTNSEISNDHTPKRRIVLCVRPSSIEQKSRRKNRSNNTPQQTKSATKRKLETSNKENPPSKSIKIAFSNARSSPKSNQQNGSNCQEKKQGPVPRKSSPNFENRLKDILEYAEETSEHDLSPDKKSEK